MNRTIWIVILLLVVVITLLIVFSPKREDYFDRVNITGNNKVVNHTSRSYYDTIVQVGLGVIGLNNTSVIINPLSESLSEQFNAHVRFDNNTYYVFIKNLNRREAIEVIAHELIHIKQYSTGEFALVNFPIVEWRRERYNINEILYVNRPWELDAFAKQGELQSSIRSLIYK